jgi:hypothetical protein
MNARALGPDAIPAARSAPPNAIWFDIGRAALTLLVAAGSVFMAQTSLVPYLWAALATTTICAYIACISERSWIRALWINLAVLSCTLGAVEACLWSKEPLERQMQYSEGFFVPDETLGYKPLAGQTLSHRTSIRNEPLYQVSYTINTDGLRVATPSGVDPSPTKPCLAFFGDSFMFGEGMPDEDTMPYQVWKKLKGTYRIVNFGFLGYGPHQMLASVQEDRLTSRGHCRPSQVWYQAIPTHVSRAAGLETWDPHGPRYVLDAQNRVRRDGHFDDAVRTSPLDWLRPMHRQFPTRIKATLEQSALYRLLLRSHRPVDEQDVALFAGIVREVKQLIETTYPQAQFHIIFWDYDDDREVVEAVQRELARQGIAVSAVSTILPNFPTYRAHYEISPYDRHPNAMAHEMIADFVAQSLRQEIR